MSVTLRCQNRDNTANRNVRKPTCAHTIMCRSSRREALLSHCPLLRMSSSGHGYFGNDTEGTTNYRPNPNPNTEILLVTLPTPTVRILLKYASSIADCEILASTASQREVSCYDITYFLHHELSKSPRFRVSQCSFSKSVQSNRTKWRKWWSVAGFCHAISQTYLIDH